MHSKASTESSSEQSARRPATSEAARRATERGAGPAAQPASALPVRPGSHRPNPPGSLRGDLSAQRAFVRERSPAYARLLQLLELALNRGLEERLSEAWRGRCFDAWYERPLLLTNALREDALCEGPSHPLWQGIGAVEADPASLSEANVADALAATRTRLWRNLTSRHLQTNDPTRAVAWLWPTHLAVESNPTRPVALVEVGASAGLNLIADRLPPIWQRQSGEPLEVKLVAPIVSRMGFDLRPLNALDDDDTRWLRACVWPGQNERLARLDAAIEAFRKLQRDRDAPMVRVGRAGAVPGELPGGEDGQLIVVYQTIVRDYVPHDEWEVYQSGLQRWLQSRPPATAMWIELEVTEAALRGGPPAALTAHLRGREGLCSMLLAHCEPHPWRLDVSDEAASRLRTEFAAI